MRMSAHGQGLVYLARWDHIQRDGSPAADTIVPTSVFVDSDFGGLEGGCGVVFCTEYP